MGAAKRGGAAGRGSLQEAANPQANMARSTLLPERMCSVRLPASDPRSRCRAPAGGVRQTRPAANDSADIGARSETPPTTRVRRPGASRAAITPQMTEPGPMGT
jgi:hypothetical protein